MIKNTLRVVTLCGLVLSSGCVSTPPERVWSSIDPDAARAEIERRLPAGVTNRSGWAVDIAAAFEALDLPPNADNVCAVIAVTQQESTFQAQPEVPGLAGIARRQIDARAASHHIPKLLVSAALAVQSPNGASYGERLSRVKTEKALSDIYEDFISMVPLGDRLFASANPVRTGGPMQVSIAFSEQHAASKRYPYPSAGSVRHDVFTRRGGMYFGIAHLLDYPAPYDAMLYRFADFNAGHFASRNAAFQNAVSVASGAKLALDGDLLLHGDAAAEASKTELAIRKVADRLDLTHEQIRSDLELGAREELAKSRLYLRLFAVADKAARRTLPRAMVPRIRLQSPKITRPLTTEWFADRVNERYQSCLSRTGRSRT